MKQNRKKIIQYCSVFAVFGSLILGLNSCYDDKMEWGDPYTHPETKDLPLALKEAISRYDVLTTYTNITLGVGIDFNLYMTDEAYRNIINENFNEVVAGNEMKQSSLLDATGALDTKRLERLDLVMEALQQAGLSVYGHTLVWHSQQRADYLNSLIKVSANMIASSNFEEFEAGANSDVLYGGGWNSWGGSSFREVSANGEGYDGYDGAASKALVIHSKGGSADYSVQATTNFTSAFVVGRKYHVVAMMRSSVENGSVRIQFQGGSATYLPADDVGTDWIKIAHDFTATNANNKIK